LAHHRQWRCCRSVSPPRPPRRPGLPLNTLRQDLPVACEEQRGKMKLNFDGLQSTRVRPHIPHAGLVAQAADVPPASTSSPTRSWPPLTATRRRRSCPPPGHQHRRAAGHQGVHPAPQRPPPVHDGIGPHLGETPGQLANPRHLVFRQVIHPRLRLRPPERPRTAAGTAATPDDDWLAATTIAKPSPASCIEPPSSARSLAIPPPCPCWLGHQLSDRCYPLCFPA